MYQKITYYSRMSQTLHVPVPAPAAPAGYQGPGDVIASPIAMWGLRAMTNAAIGANCVRLRENSGTAEEQDFVTIAGGGLDLNAINTFRTKNGGTKVFVKTLYDQSGNGKDIFTATPSEEPEFVLSGLGALPVLSFVGATPNVIRSADSMIIAQPYCVSAVANSTNTAGEQRLYMNQGVTSAILYRNSADNQVGIYNTSNLNATCSDGSWHAIGGLFNGAANGSKIVVDGSPSNGDLGVTGIAGDAIALGAYTNGSEPFTGQFVELVFWDTDVSANFVALSNNQKAYWGYP